MKRGPASCAPMVALVLALAGCGRSGEGLLPYAADSGSTTVSGTLRTPNDTAPRNGRIVVRWSDQERRATADAVGAFSVELQGAGAADYVAVDDDGNAAHGQWTVQANGSNTVGRVWLSTATASPWLVAERGLGFEERLTEFPQGVPNTRSLEVVGHSLWYLGAHGIAALNLATGASTEVLPLEFTASASFGRVPSLDGDSAPCWAMEVRQSNSFGLLDIERRALVASVPVATLWPWLGGVLGVACEADRVTFTHFKSAEDRGSATLTTWEYTRGVAAPRMLGQLTLAPLNQGGLEDGYALAQATGRAAVFLKRTLTDAGRVYEMARWDLRSASIERLGAEATFISTMSQDGLTWLDDLGNDVTLTDAQSGQTTVLASVKQQQTPDIFARVGHVPSPQRRFAVYWSTKSRRTPDNALPFPLLDLQLWRIDMKIRAIAPLPVPKALTDLFGRRLDFEVSVTDEGVASLVARSPSGGLAVAANLTTLWASPFETAPNAYGAQLFDGATVAVVEKRPVLGSTAYETSNTIFSGAPGGPLKRRTFLGGAAGATRRDGDVVYSIRRDPLTGFAQLFRLVL